MDENQNYWNDLVTKINELRKRLDGKPIKYRRGYSVTYGGVLNAYREGDLSFDEAVEVLGVCGRVTKGTPDIPQADPNIPMWGPVCSNCGMFIARCVCAPSGSVSTLGGEGYETI